MRVVEFTGALFPRIFLGLLFLAVGSLKLREWRAFKRAVAGFRIVPARCTPAVAALVVAFEISGGGMLLSGFASRAGAAIAVLLLAGFNVALSVSLLQGRRRLDCRCYGRGTLRIGWGHVAHNFALIATAALAGLGPEEPLSGRDQLLIALAAAEGVALFLVAHHMAGVRTGLIRMLSRIEVE